jgi:hypothetical protein
MGGADIFPAYDNLGIKKIDLYFLITTAPYDTTISPGPVKGDRAFLILNISDLNDVLPPSPIKGSWALVLNPV